MNVLLFKEEVEKLGIEVSDECLNKLEKYYFLLSEWNKKINLTSIIEKDMVYLKHFYDSLTVSNVVDLNSVQSLCDIGTGAGFPGIVIKIFFPHIHLTLLDSLLKRINFLNVVISELSLKNVIIIHSRAEEYGIINRSLFDVVTARAVASINILLEYSIPLLKVGGVFVAMRGDDDSNDIERALDVLNCRKVCSEHFYLPFENSSRTIILFKKMGETSRKYPRKFSLIKKYPL